MENYLIEQSNGNIYEKLFGRKKLFRGEKSFSVSFLDVLRIKEIQLILVAGGIQHLANFISFAFVGYTKEFLTTSYNYYPYFIGGCVALLVCGVFNDTIFHGKSYFLIFSLNTISITWHVLVIIIKVFNDY